MKRSTLWLLPMLAMLLPAGEAHAIGRVYARLPNNANSPIYNLRIKTMSADVKIQDQLAVTHVDQEFANDNGFRLEGFYVFTLPDGAQVHEMYLWINGVRTPYTVKKRADAVEKYEEIVARTMDPAILEQLGPNTFKLRIWPFNAYGTRRIEIQYSQPLTYYTGTIQYVFPLDMRDYTSAPIETAGLVITLASQLPITAVETSSDQFPAAVNVTKVDAYHYRIEYGVENVSFSKDFKVRCSIDRGSTSMLALSYRPDSTAEDPYFILWSAVPESLSVDSATSREITFATDVSSSMEGERLQQTKDALLSFIGLLHDEDRFNIISFSTTTVPFRPDLVNATQAARDSARTFVSRLTALGLTNFEAALRQSLLQGFRVDPLHSSVLVLTDGQPTWGETRPDSLLEFTKRWNTRGIGIFPVGVGDEPDYTLLQNIAKQNHGIFTPIAADDSIYFKVKDLYRLLYLPRLQGITMDFGTIGAYDVFPDPIPETYAGDQFLAAGRFATPGTARVTMHGKVGSTPLDVAQDVAFPDTDRTTLAIARYWGARKIQGILDLISIMGEKEELVDQVIALSIRYSVLTPYTAFLIVEPSATGPTGVGDGSSRPTCYALGQNYPNPFNPATTIAYQMPASGFVTVTVYDILGREVRTLVAEVQEAGVYRIVWDGRDARGIPVASGSYVYRMTVRATGSGDAGAYIAAKSMMLLK